MILGGKAMQRYYRHLVIFGYTIVTLFLVMYLTNTACAESKAHELQRKIADIGLLKEQLADRMQQAKSVLTELQAQQRNLATEVRLLHKSYDFKSYQQVRKFDRAHHNIELLRSLTAYSEAFAKKIRFYQSGYDKLTYLSQLAEDDIKMINAMNDFEIDALTTQISLVINTYLREAHVIQIDPEKIELATSESIWNKIVKGKL
jgi:hypothetical protein